MVERIKAWQCIGCGKLENAHNCIGICEDRRTDFVYASDYDEAVSQMLLSQRRTVVLEALVRRLGLTTPRDGEWERSFRAFRDEARKTLESLAT